MLSVRRKLAALALAGALLVTGCGSRPSTQAPAPAPAASAGSQVAPAAPATPDLAELAKKEGKVVLFTPAKGDWTTRLGQMFKARHGIDVEIVYAGSTQIFNRLRAEKDAPTGDVWMGAGGIIPFLVASKEGLLEPYRIPAVDGWTVPEKAGELVLRDPNWAFTGAYILGLGWAYNPKKTKPEQIPPLEAFADAQWKNQIEMSDPAASGTAVLFIMSVLQKYIDAGKGEEAGWEFLKKFAANSKRFTESGGAPSADVGKGDVLIGLAFDQQAYLLKHKQEPVEWYLPQNTPVLIDPMALVRKAPHPNAGKLLMQFILSREAQEMMSLSGQNVPMRTDVKWFPENTYNFEAYAKNAMKLNLDWMRDNFDRVVQRWRNEIATRK